MRKPIYAEWQVTAVVDNGKWEWYVLFISWCYLDWNKWSKEFKERKQETARFGIMTVDEKTKDAFLYAVADYRIATEALRTMLKEETDDDVKCAFEPTILIDFDAKVFVSDYPEMACPENYIPDGWTGKYESFSHMVPREKRYWLDEEGNDMLAEGYEWKRIQ